MNTYFKWRFINYSIKYGTNRAVNAYLQVTNSFNCICCVNDIELKNEPVREFKTAPLIHRMNWIRMLESELIYFKYIVFIQFIESIPQIIVIALNGGYFDSIIDIIKFIVAILSLLWQIKSIFSLVQSYKAINLFTLLTNDKTQSYQSLDNNNLYVQYVETDDVALIMTTS